MNKLIGNIVVISVVIATWCLACTVYHSQLPDQHVVYANVAMTSDEVITTLWSVWALLTGIALAIGYGVSWASRQDRIMNAPLPRELQALVATSRGAESMPLRLAEEIGARVLATY